MPTPMQSSRQGVTNIEGLMKRFGLGPYRNDQGPGESQTLTMRAEIARLRQEGKSTEEINQILGRSRTVSTEDRMAARDANRSAIDERQAAGQERQNALMESARPQPGRPDPTQLGVIQANRGGGPRPDEPMGTPPQQNQLSQLGEAAERDFNAAKGAQDQANEDRRSRANEHDELLRQNIQEQMDRSQGIIKTADREADKIRKEFESFKKQTLGTLSSRNQQFQADVTAGVVTGMQGQLNSIEQKLQSGEIGQAEAAALRDQVRTEAGSHAARIAGQAQNDFQQLFASTSSALSAQGAQVNQAAANLRSSARVQQQADMARAMTAAANGMFNTAQLMSTPDRMMSELDAMMTLVQSEEVFGDFDFSGFLNTDENFGQSQNVYGNPFQS